jgi:hypothetical protein
MHNGATVEAIRDWLVREVQGHFGTHSDAMRENQLAVQLVAWWKSAGDRSPR